MNSEDFLQRAARHIEGLVVGELLTVIEVADAGVAVWEILIDEAGTPLINPISADWEALSSEVAGLSQEWLLEFTRPRDLSHLMLASTATTAPFASAAMRALRAAYPSTRAYPFRSGESVEEMLSEAVARTPLRQRYDLVILRRDRSGHVEQELQRLFGSGFERGGHPRECRVRIAAGGRYGTTFAVLASDEDEDPVQYRVVSMESADVSPGPHTLSATLVRPGQVLFAIDGLPVPMEADPRTLLEILATAPERIESLGRVHLVMTVELCGPPDVFDQRIMRARDLVETVAKESSEPVSYSLIGYDGHAFNEYEGERDTDVDIIAWADTPQAVEGALRSLAANRKVRGNPPVAKVECALAAVANGLPDQAGDQVLGRPVLVVIGTREPHPPARDPRPWILPCPHRHDWRGIFVGMRDRHAGMAFGAIHHGDPRQEIWKHLGTHARGSMDEVDIRRFAADLGLIPSVMDVPFPLIESRLNETGGRW